MPSQPFIKKLWPFTLLISLAWSLAAATIFAARTSLYFPPSRLWPWFIFFPAAFALTTWFAQRYVAPRLQSINQRQILALFLVSLCLAGLVQLHRPAPRSALPQNHDLVITILGEKNQSSSAAGVEIARLRTLDGKLLDPQSLILSGDWTVNDDGVFVSGGAAGSRLEYHGPLAGGILMALRYTPASGKIEVAWDHTSQTLNAYSREDVTINQVFPGSLWGDGSIPSILLAGSVLAAYFLAWLGLFFTAGLLILLSGSKRLSTLIYAAAFLLILFAFIQIKQSYSTFDTERSFRDTLSYVQASEISLRSPSFWIGGRSFTLPLFYRVLGVNTGNYNTRETMLLVRDAQTWLSILSWTVLAAALCSLFRQRWLRPVVFGLVLFFSLGAEISLWDGLLLSESLSFSLFALLVGAWIVLQRLDSQAKRGPLAWLVLAGAAAVTVLFAFVRDSNLYFALAGAMMLAASWLPRPRSLRIPVMSLACFAFTGALVVFHIFNVGSGGRWQIHILDNLAVRILKDADARAYFTAAGLPLDSNLEQITSMVGYEYQPYVFTDPEMDSVREWIETKGMKTYLGYLAARPWKTLWTPVQRAANLLNGSNLEYRAPEASVMPMSSLVQRITQLYYPHSPWILWAGALLCLAGFFLFGLRGSPPQREWWILAALILSLYPLMLLIWHVNPLEIERHAAGLGIQLRLTGAASALLLLDRGLSLETVRRWLEESPQP